MRRLSGRPITWFLVVLCWVWFVSSSQAQFSIGGGEAERAMRAGVYIPYNGAPYSHRYNYEPGSFFYYGQSGQNLTYLEYLDRLDRAEKFGYRIPADPWGLTPPTASTGRPWLGIGRGLFRRR